MTRNNSETPENDDSGRTERLRAHTDTMAVVVVLVLATVAGVAVVSTQPTSDTAGVVAAQSSETWTFVESYQIGSDSTAISNYQDQFYVAGSPGFDQGEVRIYDSNYTLQDTHQFSVEGFVQDVHVNSQGVYITDDNSVMRFDSDFAASTTVLSASYSTGGISQLPNGNWIIGEAGSGTVRIYDTDWQLQDTITLSDTDSVVTHSVFDGRLYVPEFGTDRVEVYNESLSHLYTVTAPNATYAVAEYKGQVHSVSDTGDRVDVYNSDQLETPTTPTATPGPQSESLRIDAPIYLDYNETDTFTVSYQNNSTVGLGWQNVTTEATVTSDQPGLVSVDGNTVTATNNTSRAGRALLTAEYQGETAYARVTVANATIENIEYLPGTYRVSAVLGNDVLFALLLSSLVGVVGARFTTAWGGLAAAQLALTVGWLGGYVTFGIAAVGLFTALFIGLNLAANIDYQMGGVRR